MTLEELNRYQKLKSEIRALKDTIEMLELPLASHKDADGASKPSGVSDPTKAAAFKLAQCRDKLRAMEEEATVELEHIVAWMETVDNPEMRAIIQCRFIQGKTWRMVTRSVYGMKATAGLSQSNFCNWLRRKCNG